MASLVRAIKDRQAMVQLNTGNQDQVITYWVDNFQMGTGAATTTGDYWYDSSNYDYKFNYVGTGTTTMKFDFTGWASDMQITSAKAAKALKVMQNSLKKTRTKLQATNGGSTIKNPQSAAPPRGFNRYVNGSDLLEEFIKFAGEQGARKGDIMGLPVELFIKWLIIQACEQDEQDPGDIVVALPPRPKQPRCLGCQHFMSYSADLLLCGRECSDLYYKRLEAA